MQTLWKQYGDSMVILLSYCSHAVLMLFGKAAVGRIQVGRVPKPPIAAPSSHTSSPQSRVFQHGRATRPTSNGIAAANLRASVHHGRERIDPKHVRRRAFPSLFVPG